MDQFLAAIQWIVLLIVFVGMAILQWRVIRALDDALARVPQPGMPPLPAGATTVTTAVVPPKSAPVLAPHDTAAPVDDALVAAVKKFEGFSAKAYGDYKQYSIGYGTKATSPTEVIDEAEADKRLRTELANAAKSVETFCPNAPKGVKQGLIDLTYNVGPVWESKELGQLVKAADYENAKAHVLQYNHAGGAVLDALTKRRQAEVEWFDHPL